MALVFFPKGFFEDNIDDVDVAPKVEVEIEIRISATEGSKAEKCGVEGNLEPLSEASDTGKDVPPNNSGRQGQSGITIFVYGFRD
jgi:hypothetical protein